MNFLGVDASSSNLSFCLVNKEKIIFDFNKHFIHGASLLAPNLEKYLKKAKVDLSDIDVFFIGSGPGSFTGLRVSFSLMKAFVLVMDKPIIPVCSFLSCAYSVRRHSGKIAVISDARKGLIYGACFEAKPGYVTQVGKTKLYTLKEFVLSKKDHFFVTYDSHLRKQALGLQESIDFYSKDVYPSSRGLLGFVKDCHYKKKFITIKKLEPLYLHPKTCQIRKANNLR